MTKRFNYYIIREGNIRNGKKYSHLNADHLMAHAGSIKFTTQF